MCLPDRAAVATMLGVRAFVRLCATDDALLVSDAPKRMDAQALQAAITRLEQAGYTASIVPRGLLAIDWNETRWQAFSDRYAASGEPVFPQDEKLHSVYELARLMRLHPVRLARQPKPMLRALAKAACRKGGLVACAPNALVACAQRLRLHEALPSAAMGLLTAELYAHCAGGGEDEI